VSSSITVRAWPPGVAASTWVMKPMIHANRRPSDRVDRQCAGHRLDGDAALAQQPQEAPDDHHGNGCRDEDVRCVGELAGGGAGGDEEDQDDHHHADAHGSVTANLLALARGGDRDDQHHTFDRERSGAITSTTSASVSRKTIP
jgi:hypothetical protein